MLSDTISEFKKFVENVDAPVALSLMGQCAFDNTDKRFIGMLGMHGTKTSLLTIGECDLMIVLGSRFSDRVSCDTNTFAKDIKILHIDIDPAEVNKNIIVDYNVVGNLTYILKEINNILPQQNHKEWMDKVYSWKEQYPVYMVSEDEEAVLPQHVIETLDKLTDGKAIITTEVGQHQMWAAQFYNFKARRSFATSGGLGTMGYGLGAAIGSKIGNPDRTVVNIAGDGSFYMNLTELSTMAKYKIPVIELILNNNVLGMVRQWQKMFYDGRFSNTTLDKDTDFIMLANAFGLKAFTISKKSEVEEVLKKQLN